MAPGLACRCGWALTADEVTPATTVAATITDVTASKNGLLIRRLDAFMTSPCPFPLNLTIVCPYDLDLGGSPLHRPPVCARLAMRNACVSRSLDSSASMSAESTPL